MFFRKNKKQELMAFATGKVVPLKDVHDEMFSAGLMGTGIAIDSLDGKYYSPVDGKVTMLFPTKHALGIETKTGKELLLHVGIDTVNLKGEGFTAHTADGQTISAGDLLLEADVQAIQAKGYHTEAILCVCEPKESQVTCTELENVTAKQDVILTIKE